MIGGKTIYEEIASKLFSIAPNAAKTATLKATGLTDTVDACTFQFDYVDENNERKWFFPESKTATGDFRKLLYLLRKSYIESGQPSWFGCDFAIKIKSGKFELNLKYPD